MYNSTAKCASLVSGTYQEIKKDMDGGNDNLTPDFLYFEVIFRSTTLLQLVPAICICYLLLAATLQASARCRPSGQMSPQ